MTGRSQTMQTVLLAQRWREGAGAVAAKYGLLAILALLTLALLRHGTGGVWQIPLALLVASMAALVALCWPMLEAGGDAPMAELIAFVGCDGSGKSTLSTDILAEVAQERPVELCYLGLGSGTMGERLKRWPLIGPALERRLSRKARQTRTRGQKIPGLPTAIVVYLFSLARLRRFRRMLALRRAGVTVITDRYPQVEVPGFYDGPGLSAGRPGSWAVAALARQERRIYDWMAGFRPDVVIRLNVDAETAHARKPDHGYELLRQKVSVTPGLRFGGARIVDLDSCEPYGTVRAAVAQVVHGTLGDGVVSH